MLANMPFDTYYAQSKLSVEKATAKFLDMRGPSILVEALNYSALLQSKRLRGVLVLLSAQTFGIKQKHILPLSVAIELIHTYSLIHDDLPCMDDDDIRRGKPSNHKVYGEAMAILAGDAMMTMAYEILATELIGNFSPKLILEVIAMIGKATGVNGMVGGQVLDLAASDKIINASDLKSIHELKTGALIAASILTPLKLTDISDHDYKKIEIYANCMGLAFQIVDDILDETGDKDKLGKPIGSDKDNNKATYVSLFGIDEAKKMAVQVANDAKDALNGIDKNLGYYHDYVDFVIGRDC
jgi:geranylgeranyl diphosphate synthase, type II